MRGSCLHGDGPALPDALPAGAEGRVMDRTRDVLGGGGVTFERYYPSMPLC
ncbi:predicted protein [Streptomyces iranensis]|uniref:Uncharacterized protein n=1 Tax=Streptomyces iranensis TaxID=576784 RepID=A0A060ZZD3_9ACTN|nr:predicted protein [Streptomyces iranensis]